MPSRMFGSGRDALPYDWEWPGGLPECPRVVGMPSRMTRRVGSPTQMSGSGQEALLDVSEALSDDRD